MANDSLGHLISTLNLLLADRQASSGAVPCFNNWTLIWFNANASVPIFANAKPASRISHEEEQIQAVLYIVVVLMFYSITIAAAMIKYMYQETQQATEDQVYQDFLTQTKQMAIQQTKKDFAHRVSIQLVAMSRAFNARPSTVTLISRRSTLPAVEETDADTEGEYDHSDRDTGDTRRISLGLPVQQNHRGSAGAISLSSGQSSISDGPSWSASLSCTDHRSPSISEPKVFAGSAQRLTVM